MSGKTIRVLYISGFGRSGSTIVDNVLGQVDGFFSAGELRLAWDAARLEARLCGCGQPLSVCPVWSRVLPHGPALPAGRRYPESHAMWARLLAGRPAAPPDAVARALAERYRRIVEVTGCRIVIDSSKKPLYGWLLGSLPEVELYVLHMLRDPRGVAWSWQKRKRQPGRGAGTAMRRHGPVQSALLWTARNLVVEREWGRQPSHYRQVRYETLVREPRATFAGIADWLGLPLVPDPFVSADTVALRPNHTVWGNPSRFETGDVRLRADDAWTRELTPWRRRLVEWITAPCMRRYGYER